MMTAVSRNLDTAVPCESQVRGTMTKSYHLTNHTPKQRSWILQLLQESACRNTLRTVRYSQFPMLLVQLTLLHGALLSFYDERCLARNAGSEQSLDRRGLALHG